MRSLVSFLLICLSFFLPALSFGQQPALRNYTVDNGLPSSEIYHIIQDTKGYIWMATNMGVSRFDGRTFKNFDVQNGLPENTVFEIFEDESNRLWFVSFPFQLSYFQNDSIHQYKYNSKLKDIAGHGLIPLKKSFYVNILNEVFFSFLNGGQLYKINDSGRVEVIDDIKKTNISVRITDIDGHLLASQNGEKTKGDFKLSYRSTFKDFTATIRNAIGRYAFGNIMMGLTIKDQLIFVRNEFATIIQKDSSLRNYNLMDRILWLSIEDNGSVWIGKEIGGAEKYLCSQTNFALVESYLLGKAVSSVFTDNEGGTWFSTLGSGVYYLPSKAFISYTQENGLSGKNIQSIEFFSDNLYIGSDSYSLDVITAGKVTRLNNFGNDNKTINILKSINNSQLWIGAKTNLFRMADNRFYKIENKHPKIQNPRINRNFIFSIKDVYPVDSSTILVAQMRSLSIVKDDKVVYDSYLDDHISLRVESIEKEATNSYLLGTFNGLWRYKDSTLKYLGENNELLDKRITDIVMLKNPGEYVVGTKGFGIIINLKDTNFKITQNEGLSSNSVTSLLLTGDTLWIATNNGLNALDIKKIENEPRIFVFTKDHGLISNEINQLKYHKNKLFIATNGGLTIFNLKLYKSLKNPPPVYINAFNVLARDTSISNDYKFKHFQNFITISYNGINFRDAGELLYKYRLKGLTNNWVYTRNLQVEYAFLPPGNYKFEVYAINSDGLISSTPATLRFTIRPPFWKTWWFISLTIISGIALIVLYLRIRLKMLRKEHKLQSDIGMYREQALIRQMDPHFVFNSLNSIQSFIIKNDSAASSHYLSKFARLMRLILNNSQKQAVTVSDEVDALSLYMELESMRFKHKFDFEITVDPEIESDSTYIPAFLVQPFIENAIWHGIMNLDKTGVIKVEFKKDNNQILCFVEDNGVGRKRAAELKSTADKYKKSMGISIVESRLILLSDFYGVRMKMEFDDLFDEAQIPVGTRVSVNMPIVK